MPHQSARPKDSRRTTPKCPRCKRFCKEDFPTTTSVYRLKNGEVRRKTYELNYCVYCLRDQKRDAERRRGSRSRKRTRERQRRENARPANKEARRRYRQTRKGKEADRRTKHKSRFKKKARWTAVLPTPVLTPLVERAVEQAGSQIRLSEVTGVPVRRIWAIVNGDQRGVSVGVVDRLAMACDFTLEEITERAEEWALLTGDSWPIGYKREKGHNSPVPRHLLKPQPYRRSSVKWQWVPKSYRKLAQQIYYKNDAITQQEAIRRARDQIAADLSP